MTEMEIRAKMKNKINGAYSCGYCGKPCAVWPRLTAETGMEEIRRKAGTISAGDSDVDALLKVFYINYMCAWQEGARALDCMSDGIEVIHRKPTNEKGE